MSKDIIELAEQQELVLAQLIHRIKPLLIASVRDNTPVTEQYASYFAIFMEEYPEATIEQKFDLGNAVIVAILQEEGLLPKREH